MSLTFPRLAVAGLSAVALGGFGTAVALAEPGPASRSPQQTTTSTTTTAPTTTTGTTTTGTTTSTGTTTTGTTTSTATTTTGTATSTTSTTAPLTPVLAPVTQSPTNVGPESAVLHGTVDDEGQGGSYSFEYDTVSDYNGAGDTINGTQTGYVQPGSTSLTNVTATIGCYPASVCTAEGETALQPNTKYEYILDFATGTGSKVSNEYESAQGTFTTTKFGTVRPGSQTLSFSGRSVGLSLTCSSAETCSGALAIAAKVKHSATVCATSKYNVGAGDVKTLNLNLSSRCVNAAKAAKGGKLAASLAIKPTTGQPNVSEKVTLLDTSR